MFYIWSHGCAAQFRSRFVFALMTHFNPDYIIQWYYGRYWGKHQKYDFSILKIKKCVINGAKDSAEYANKIINSISSLCLVEYKIMAEPQDIETSPKFPRTLKVSKVLKVL